ncbi:MAG: hypothetical protein D6681_19855 [Calditrichaeota bacterium]|nr:MAG: hypothetical protein D6681_19855 [Calditrichota bacterium]
MRISRETAENRRQMPGNVFCNGLFPAGEFAFFDFCDYNRVTRVMGLKIQSAKENYAPQRKKTGIAYRIAEPIMGIYAPRNTQYVIRYLSAIP